MYALYCMRYYKNLEVQEGVWRSYTNTMPLETKDLIGEA